GPARLGLELGQSSRGGRSCRRQFRDPVGSLMIFYLLCDRCHAPATKIVAVAPPRLDESLCSACYVRTVDQISGSRTLPPSAINSAVIDSGVDNGVRNRSRGANPPAVPRTADDRVGLASTVVAGSE